MKKRKWIWLGLWILSLAGISFYGGAVSYGFFFALTLLPVVSCIYLLCVSFRFKIYQEAESRTMVCGQAMPYYFVLRNEGYFGFAGVKVRMFPHFSYVENVKEDVEYELLPGDEFIYRTQVVCKYRGEYEVGVKEVVVTDFFGIFHFRYKVLETIRAIVRPKIVELSEIAGLSDITMDLQKESLFAKSEPDVVVRDYIRGDSLKKIHWKATAREQKLKVRTDTGAQKQGICLLFDTKRYSKKMEEYLPLESKILEILLAVGIFFAKRNIPISVCYTYGRSLMKNNVAGMSGFEEFYGRMSEVFFEEDVNPALTMQQSYDQGFLVQAKVVIGIFHQWNDEMMNLAEQISAAGTAVVIYVVTEDGLESYIRQNTIRRRIIAVPVEAEIGEVL